MNEHRASKTSGEAHDPISGEPANPPDRGWRALHS
jgi:hypothetical protein